MNNNKNKSSSTILCGLFWTFGERITAQFVTTIVTIILARILEPSHYGIISIVTIFITICNVFVTGGFGNAVVQKKDATDEDYNTAFIISLITSIFVYLIIFITAPIIAKFYKMKILIPVLRVMGIRIIISSLNSLQHASIQKQMKFKQFFFATLIGTVISAIIGIILAYSGYGVWALVIQYLTNTIIDSIVLLIVGTWKPKIQFNIKKAKKLFSFGWKVLATQLIYTLEADIRSLIVGKVFGAADLAYYDQGKKYPSLLVTNINNSINKVMLPVYSNKQDNIDNIRDILRKSVKIGVYLLSPLLIGFAILSKNFVLLFLTEKWIPCIPYIQIFCLIYLTRPLESSCHQALLGIGESGLVMKLMLIINLLALLTVLIATFIFKKVLLIALGSLFTTIISIISFMTFASKKINYKPKEQIKDIFPPIILSAIMGIIVYYIKFITTSLIIATILQIVVGGVSYILLSIIFKIDSYNYLKNKIKNFFRKKVNI